MIPYGKHYIDDEDIQAVIDVLKTGALTQGPLVNLFEESVANFVGAKYAVAFSSGTAGLHAANLIAGINKNNYLITTPITFVSTANAAKFCGGNVLLADINPDTLNISRTNLESIFETNKNIRAISPVHFAGFSCDMFEIQKIARKNDCIIIEDAAHAFGGKYFNDKYIGCCDYSDMTVFSFHPVKAIAAGEGGMVTTNDLSIYKRLLRLRSHGINKLDDNLVFRDRSETKGVLNSWYYEMQELGFNYRITDIQCALALSQLKKINKFISRRRKLVERYDQFFKKLPFCEITQEVGRDISAHHLYVLRINFKEFGISRAELMNQLKLKGIGTQVHYIPIFYHPYYKDLFANNSYPESIKYYEEALSIPLYYDLSNEEQEYVCNTFNEIFINL